jgi:LmbE family N-acetylglucosaminyl deacetylase
MFLNDKNLITLAVGAHADDIEYGCGGLLASSHKALGLTVCTFNEEERKREAQNAGNILDCEIAFLNQKNSSINERETIGLIENHIKLFNPSIIAVHWPQDTHQDHRIVTNSVLSAARGFHGTIIFYKSRSSINYLPNIFLELSEENWNKKVKSIKAHNSQADKSYLNENFLKTSFFHWPENYRGKPGPCETFSLYRSIN